MKHAFTIVLFLFIHGLNAQSPCENGLSDGTYPCNQITMLAHMTPDEVMAVAHNGYWLNDIWGWTDPETGREYAIVGLKDGVSFVDVTLPTSPVLLGKLQEPTTSNNRTSGMADIQHGKSTWRDIKTYANHAFIVSDINGAHGMQVFDLTKLRGLDGSEATTFEHDAHYEEFGSAHNIVINEASGYAYAVGISAGGERCSGGLHIIDINDPKNPAFVSCFAEDGYTHDAQCVIYEGTDEDYQGKEIGFNSNEDSFTIVNLEDKEEPTMISRTEYHRSVYSHQGWLSEDHRYFLMNDELDENQYGFNPRTLIWDIADLDEPQLIGEYFNNATAIDHNLYTHNDMIYESNYMSGLRVLDMQGVAEGKLRERAYFDTYPAADQISFGGAWSSYPYFESGTIIVSDMNNGLFLLQLSLEEEIITSHPEDWLGCEDETLQFSVTTAAEDVIFQWQKFDGQTYESLTNGAQYSGTQTNELTLTATPGDNNADFRCKITRNGHLFYSLPATYSFSSVGEPRANFTFEVGESGAVVFNNNSQNAASYFWDFGDGQTSEEENPEHNFEFGTFTVSLTAIHDCAENVIEKSIFVVTGIDQQAAFFNLYPNPTTDLVNVFSKEAGRLQIRDVSGKLVHNQLVTLGAHAIKLDKLRKGVYFISLQTAEGLAVKRLIIE